MTDPDRRHAAVDEAERAQALRALDDQLGQGRIGQQEYEDRRQRVYAAQTGHDLDVLLSSQQAYPPAYQPQSYSPPPQPYGGPPPGPGYGGVDPSAPFGRSPITGQPFSDKSKVVAGVLNIFISGVGRMYAGQVGIGVAQLLVSIFTLGFGHLWSFIDGIIILTGEPTDGQGFPLRS